MEEKIFFKLLIRENYIMKLGGIHNHEANPNVVNKMLNSNVDPLKKDE